MHKLIELYKAQNGTYPTGLTAGIDICVGTNYPNAKCRDYQSATNYTLESDTSFSSKLATVGSVPSGGYLPSNGTVGPYIYTNSDGSGFRLITVVDGEANSDCPPGMTITWNDTNSSRLLCVRY